jgi:hypothetical protein
LLRDCPWEEPLEGTNVVIIARIAGTCYEEEGHETPYKFKINECGVLINSWEPWVVWDDDGELRPRKVLFAAIEIVGIQFAGKRVISQNCSF